MEKIIRFPWAIPFIGMLIGFALLITLAFIPDMTLMISALVVLFISVWMLALKFFVSIFGFYSSILGSK